MSSSKRRTRKRANRQSRAALAHRASKVPAVPPSSEEPEATRDRPPRTWGVAAVLAAVVALAMALAWYVRAHDQPPPAVHTANTPDVSPPPAPAPETSAPDPAPIDTAFIGAKACRECHEEEHDAWARDWHAKALTRAKPDTVVGDYTDAHFKGTSSEAWMNHHDDGFIMRTRDRAGKLDDYPVQWLIGGKRMQDPITVMADGGWQVLPVYYHVRSHSWVDYTERKQGTLDPDHPFFWTNFRRTANHECLDCHVTALSVDYDRQAQQWRTGFIDAGVACESCHGPGRKHAQSTEPGDIVQPRKLDDALGLAVCAQCHGIHEPLYPMVDSAHRFRPGQRYEERFKVIAAVGTSGLMSDFYADGRPRSSSYEYQALIQSSCYLKGGATCLSCHTAPHEVHEGADLPVAETRTGPWENGDLTCRGCHEAVFSAGARHTHHAAKAAQSCVACHMPRVIPSVFDTFADHAIDVPVPENTARYGIPNGCNACHVDKTPEDMASALVAMWPGATQRQARRLQLATAYAGPDDQAALAALRAVLADTSEAPSLRGAAALRLAQRFAEDAPQILTPYASDRHELVRAQVIDALKDMPTDAVIPVAQALVDDDSLMVRKAAALALATHQTPGGEAAALALTKNPGTDTMVLPYIALGMYAMSRDDLDGAETVLERALDLQPYNINALLLLAQINADMHQMARARQYAREVLHFAPRHPLAMRLLAATRGAP